MSEISSGVMARHNKKEELEAYIEELNIEDNIGFIYSINDAWVSLFLADEYLMDGDSIDILRKISMTMPLLYLYNSDDYGWGLKIFNEGKSTAEFACPYILEEGMELVIEGIKPEAFRLFEIDMDTSLRATQLLTSGSTSPELFMEFKEIIGLEEFRWMSYSYLIDKIVE